MATETLEAKAPDFIHVNLLPIEYRVVRKDYSWLIDMRILVSVTALIAVSAAYVIGQSFFRANLEGKQAELEKVQQEIGANAYVGSRIKELEKLRDEKTSRASASARRSGCAYWRESTNPFRSTCGSSRSSSPRSMTTSWRSRAVPISSPRSPNT
jgi:hypothetical protein